VAMEYLHSTFQTIHLSPDETVIAVTDSFMPMVPLCSSLLIENAESPGCIFLQPINFTLCTRLPLRSITK
jgi:hypothetical protein